MDRTEGAGAEQRTPIRRVALASFVGTAMEWYDFFLYGTASALIFNELFFPEQTPLIGTLLAFATFGGGVAPLIATALLAATDGAYWPIALCMIAMALVTVVAVYIATETSNIDIHDSRPERRVVEEPTG
jgi:MFS family permease